MMSLMFLTLNITLIFLTDLKLKNNRIEMSEQQIKAMVIINIIDNCTMELDNTGQERYLVINNLKIMDIVVEQKKIRLDNRILMELENFHKNSESIYNNNGEKHKSAFCIISVKDVDDVIKVDDLLSRLDIKLLSDKNKFLEVEKEKPVENNFIIKDGNGWRIQSHYMGYGMSVDDLKKCVDYITKKGNMIKIKDYTIDKISSRIKELKEGKKLYDMNEKILIGDKKTNHNIVKMHIDFGKIQNL